MPRLAANLSYLFTERPFLDRFEAAARWGFRAVEHQFPYTEASESAIRERLRTHNLAVVLFNLPPGEEGERGLGGLPGREAEFREGLDLSASLPPCHRLSPAARDVGRAGGRHESRGEPRHLRRQPA